MKNIYVGCLIALFVLTTSKFCLATAIDLSWSSPENLNHNNENGDENFIFIWHYNIENTTDNSLPIPFDIYLVTENGDRHEDIYKAEIVETLIKRDGPDKKYEHAKTVKDELGPKELKNCLAIFENINPESKKVYIYVLGLRHFSFWRPAMREYIYKITYERSIKNSWRLLEHGFSKDTTARYRPFDQ